MCGIAGIFDPQGPGSVDRGALARMTSVLSHRGPDGDGFHVGPGIGLGHRRLAIIDPEGGRQPIYNEDGSVAVVFNGCIYNFQALKAELERAGHRFRTNCDTEVLVHAWESWGTGCVDRLRGMFAFALWDAADETLFLARDRLGKKPLHYARLPGGEVAFGSELKALIAHPDLPRRIDPCAVDDYFTLGYIPDPRTILADVEKLPPAHWLRWQRGHEPRCERYWDVRFTGDGPGSVGEAAEELIPRLREAVRLRLVSDVPLGAFLSGGVDSSGIVALMADGAAGPVNTFAVGFGEQGFDETAYAAQVAERYATNHRTKRVDPAQFDLVDRLALAYDEPFGDSSALPTYQVCAAAREHVTVALSGDGGDELFAGYRRYLWHMREAQLRRMLPEAVSAPLFGLLARHYPPLGRAPRWLRAKHTFEELALSPEEAFVHSVSVTGADQRRSLYAPGFARQLDGYEAGAVVAGAMRRADTDDPLGQAQYADLHTWLPGDILTKVDRASMATSLEVRAPLLDHEFVEWAATLPPALKLRGGSGKYAFKRALEPLVPHDVLYRPKQGFSMPLAKWFRGPLLGRLRQAASSEALTDAGILDRDAVGRMIDEHASGARDHAAVLWLVLMLERCLDSHGSDSISNQIPSLRAG